MSDTTLRPVIFRNLTYDFRCGYSFWLGGVVGQIPEHLETLYGFFFPKKAVPWEETAELRNWALTKGVCVEAEKQDSSRYSRTEHFTSSPCFSPRPRPRHLHPRLENLTFVKFSVSSSEKNHRELLGYAEAAERGLWFCDPPCRLSVAASLLVLGGSSRKHLPGAGRTAILTRSCRSAHSCSCRTRNRSPNPAWFSKVCP